MRYIFLIAIIVCSKLSFSQTQFKIEQNQLVLPGQIVFETGSDKIKMEESKNSLEHIKAYLLDKTYVTLMRIESHCDSGGNAESNQLLTEKRAKAVYEWLVANGIDCKRLMATGFGSSKPIADNSTAEGKAMNRRINLVNAELRDRAIGGMPLDGGGKVSASCR